MDLRNGKTIRRCLQHIPQDSLLEVSNNSVNRESISVFGYELCSNLQYSMKKKNRWEIIQMMFKGCYEDNQPVIYSKHQCVNNCSPLLDVYLYDSILEKEVGNAFISNQRLEKGSFNSKSAIKQIENRLDYTKKEKQLFEQSKQRGRQKRKPTRKSHRSERMVAPESDEQLPLKEEYVEDRKVRQKCVYIKEYVHVNNISAVNKMTPVHGKRCEMSKEDLIVLKRKENKFLRSVSLEDEELEEEEDIVSVPHVEDTIRPFIITGEDFLCRSTPISHKKRRRERVNVRKRNQNHRIVSNMIEPLLDDFVTVIDLHEDMLPYVAIETDAKSFVDDVMIIKDFCRCRISASEPPMILVDLDDSVESAMKSFLVLKAVNCDINRVSVKVIMNIGDRTFDHGQIFDQSFDSVCAIVAFVQARLKEVTSKRYTPSRNLLILDGKIDGMANLWNTKKNDTLDNLYMLHKEWISENINEEILYSMVLGVPQSLSECAVCFCDVLDEEMIVLGECGHVVCISCASSHIVWRLESGLREMNCPGSDCTGYMDVTMILSLVSWRRYCKRLELLETSVIGEAGCPCKACGAVLIDSVKKKVEYRCVCGRDVCSGCGRLRHFPSSCHEMMSHQRKMVALRDLDMVSLKVKPLIYSGRPCPKCFNFVVKEGGCNHISCNCGAHFCWGCGDSMNEGRHLLASFPCSSVSELLKHDLTRQSIVPDPSSIRPRLYCKALIHYIDNHNYDSVKFYKRISSILQCQYSTEEAMNIVDQITELSTVIECIFVKAYQMDRRRQLTTYRYMRSIVSLFIFFQLRIKSIVESVYPASDGSGLGNRSRPISKREISEHSKKLTTLVTEVHGHLDRFRHFFDR